MDIDYQRLSQAIMLGIADGQRLAREDRKLEERYRVALHQISLASQNTMGGNSTDLGRIARTALEGEPI